MHNRYRAAKRFKLNDDMEVEDAFSGAGRNALKRTWDYYDRRHHAGMWKRFPDIRRWLHSRVGKKWDDVFAEFIRFTNTQSAQAADFLRNRMDGAVNEHVWIEGNYICTSKSSWRSSLQAGDLYTHPVTRLLCRVPPQPKVVKERVVKSYVRRVYTGVWNWRNDYYGYNRDTDYNCAVHHKFGDKMFWKGYTSYQRKVAPGKFVDVAFPVWRRDVTMPKLVVSHYVTSEGRVIGQYLEGCYPVWKMGEEVVKQTASKKDIRQYKLNEKE